MAGERGAEQTRERESRAVSREDYARAAAEIEAAVEAGRISRDDAQTRLEEMREAMADRGGRERVSRGGERNEERNEERLAEYRRIERRIRAAVEAGEMSLEDAERRLIEARIRIFGADR